MIDSVSGDYPQSKLFESLCRELLREGMQIRFQARGASMSPAIRDGEIVHVKHAAAASLRKGEIVLVKSVSGFRLHRLVAAHVERDEFITRGDCGTQDDCPVRGKEILGLAVSKEVRIGKRIVRAKLRGMSGRVARGAARSQALAKKLLRIKSRPQSVSFSAFRKLRAYLSILTLLVVLLAAMFTSAQVAVDATTNGSASLTGTGTPNITFAHTTAATANRLLLVGVSLNITNAPTTTVNSVTYNGTALTLLGSHNDAGNTRRVEMWYLLAPANGTFNVIVKVNIPSNVTEGVVAGATTFTGVDQTVPLGTFVSADGANGGNSQLDVPSVVNGMILDTLATGGNQTITVPGPQVTQWDQRSSNSGNPGIRSEGTSRAGAPSVPISETLSGTSNWSLGAVSVNPTTADIGVSTAVNSAVFLGQNSTYTITVSNNGPSAANSVTLTDALAAGLTLVSVTPSAGTSCTGTGPINCTLPASFASGATATVTVVVNAIAAGSYANTATVADSGAPPDSNTGNNTYSAVATVQSVACATVAQAVPGGTLSGVVNTYYPGSASVAAGGKSIPVGTARGGGAIAAGNLLLVIQMQDAGINSTNTVAYGNGSNGSGFTALNNAGNYEFVTATGAVSGGAVAVSGAGSGGGLVFGYNSAAATGTKGQSTYQIVLIPQYTTATLPGSGLTASPWNGATGGVLALDTSSTLTLNGATVSVDGLGFRGGAGLQLSGGVGGSNTDFMHTSPAAYGGTVVNGVDAPKGEGIAGTPFWVESAGSYLNTGVEGYPGGSMARGAPGNAGGGGTDADPNANDENAGGGGGGNGGAGGFGGDSWNTNLSSGGEGGAIFPATINRVALGGGGGGGSRNNSDGDTLASSGAAGGGVIIIRADSLSGSATLTANGAAAYIGTSNDAGGGGGAGGSIVVLSANGGESGMTVRAQGGRGGDAWDSQPYSLGDRHGPGGGGGGGVALLSGAPASISVTGGASGTTLNPGVAYGATAGAAGSSATNVTISQTSGIQSGSQCTPDVTLGKSHVGNFTRGSSASYTVPVSNLSAYGATSGVVTINDTLPSGLVPTTATGTGWSCSVVAQTVSCVRSDSLVASSSYPSITINAAVSSTAPASVTNTAFVAGGGEINLANDSATDVAIVGSSADLSVTDTASPNPVAAGTNITYTQIVSNNGPSSADSAVLVATIPANTALVSMTPPAGWTCATGSSVVCSSPSMAGSTAATFSMVVKVNAGTANGTVISETATASSAISDPNSANNTATVATVVGVTAGADLSVSNMASPNPVVAGNNATYTQAVTNTGSAAATTATFTEATPTNTTLVSISAPAGWTCLPTPPPVSCTDPSVAAGASGTFTVVYKVNGATASGTVITDTATVGASNDSFSGDNSATATDVVASAGQADLSLSTVATPSTVNAGNNIAYTQTVTNNGPAAASTVSFTEAIPANTTFVSVSAPAGWTCTTTTSVTCTNPSLAAGASADIIIFVNVAPSVAAGTITANSSVSSATSDPTLSNNSTVVTTLVQDKCDLAVTNGDAPDPVAAGGNITYTQTVSNSGPSNCSTATFTEVVPTNTTFQSLTPVPSGWSCTLPTVGSAGGTISCSDPSVAPGSSSSFPVVVKVNAGTASGTVITDTATGATSTHDTNSGDDSATATATVAGATQADLSVTNTGSPNPVAAGSNITYTQTVKNGGPAAAATITYTNALPANTTFVSLSGPAGWTCSNVTFTCTIATLAANATANFTFVVKVNATAVSGSTITDAASVSTTTSDPNSANNSASASVLVSASADLSVTNSPAPVPVQAGGNITYTQVVTNAGPGAATSASFTETIPANTTFVSLSPVPSGWSCTVPAVGGTGTITCTNTSFAPGTASFPVIVKVTAGTSAGTTIIDTATISSATTDPNSANNSATASDVVASAAQSDLIVTNSAAPTSVTAGSNITYTQSVTNKGPAVASALTFSEATPPNTNFQSITTPAGWTCTTPAIGAAGTITCTDGSSLAVNASAAFTLVLQVNAATASGTSIADTATAMASNIVPGLTTNTATATVSVASATSADMAIVKTATPASTVPEGDSLVYTLTVTNNGPATATNVTVSDPLPTSVTFLSVSSTVGSCSQAGGTVTCQLGTMANAATATVSIITMTAAPGVVANTATVSADQTDPTSGNNSSTQTETITSPTKIQLRSFNAYIGSGKIGTGRVVLLWKTGGESHNLGFNVYREQEGQRIRVNPSLIAGSALRMSGALPKHSGKSYAWIDSYASAGSGAYWLEDVEVNGTRSMHGPVSAEAFASTAAQDEIRSAPSALLNQLNLVQTAMLPNQASRPVEHVLPEMPATSVQRQKQFELAAHRAVKILVKHEGWYRVSQPDLVKAGLDPAVDPALLHLFAEAVEQPIQLTGTSAGPGGFGSQAAINFYGTGIDTQYSGTRAYWLVAGPDRGLRIPRQQPASGSNLPPASFFYTVQLQPRTTYFAALITPDGNNFFGAFVSPAPVDQLVSTPHLDSTSADAARLEVVLQGIIAGAPHDVSVALNGTDLGNLLYTGQSKGKFRVNLPQGLLQEGDNTITLTSQDGDYDSSLVDSIRVTYPHTYAADSSQLQFTARAGENLKLTGFDSPPAAVLDITDPDRPLALTPQVRSKEGVYEFEVQVPWSSANASLARHSLLAVAESRIDSAVGIVPNHPSHWHSPQPGGEIVMISYPEFTSALAPLVRSHQAEGKSSAVVLTSELFDEFNFGERSPYAVRDFLQAAIKNWQNKPKYLLLNGKASVDPRDYLGFGHLDFVPTKIVPTPSLMTASDGWFSDFRDTGMPSVATGRLPVSSLDEAQAVISKIVAYEGGATNGPWTSQALMVADRDDTESFSQDSESVQALLPSTLEVTDVLGGTVDSATARQEIVSDINSGQLLVNYTGHGSEEEWSGDDMFDTTSAAGLTNGSSLPVFLIMDCLNGFFQDVYEQTLGVTLLLQPNGGAAAVLASSGLNQSLPQVNLNKLIVRNIFSESHPSLGEAILSAKSRIADRSVRETYNLFGDPAMQVKSPGVVNAAH